MPALRLRQRAVGEVAGIRAGGEGWVWYELARIPISLS
jgi:hypothetical protein